MRCIEAFDIAWSKLAPGTIRSSKFDWKCAASPLSTSQPVFGKCSRSDSWPGVWPGVEISVTLPSPNASLSPSTFGHGAVGAEGLSLLREGEVVFGLLDEQHRGWELVDVADMVGMCVGDRHIADVGGLEAERGERRDERLVAVPDERAEGPAIAVRAIGDRVHDAGAQSR